MDMKRETSFTVSSCANFQPHSIMNVVRQTDRFHFFLATYCTSQAYVIEYATIGRNLNALAESLQLFYNRVIDLGQHAMALVLQPVLQSILNQLSVPSDWSDVAILTGEVMNESEYLQEPEVADNPMLTAMTLLLKANLAASFGMFHLADTLFRRIAPVGGSLRFTHGVILWYEVAGLTQYSLFEATRKRRHLTMARSFRTKLTKLDSIGCPNTSGSIALLSAKEATVLNLTDHATLLRQLSDSLLIVERSGRANAEGVLNEIAFFACAKRNMATEAKMYLKGAMKVYQHDVKSVAKSFWLEERSATALSLLRCTPVRDQPFGTSITLRSKIEK